MNEAQLLACRQLMKGGSKSFFLASLLLPGRVCAPASALYAFCRIADDAIDDSAAPGAALLQLAARLDDIYAGTPGPEVADQALAGVVADHRLPRPLLDALLEGFAWDATGRRYETLEDLHAYAARVAGTVGALMALVMETRAEWAVARACELGIAMQLTNIARDVGDDARMGRLYLPRAWMREEGLDPDAWLARPVHDERLQRVLRRVLAEAERLYRRAECGVRELPRDCRPAILAARLIYSDIGRGVAEGTIDPLRRRSVVPLRRKLVLLLRSMRAWWVAPGEPIAAGAVSAPLLAVRFLVDAAASHELPRRTFYQRTVRMLHLFERQAQRRAGDGAIAA